MALIQVNSQKLGEQIDELTSLNKNLQIQVEELGNIEMSLASMWAGDAKDAFHTTFNHDKAEFQEFYDLVLQYIQVLTEAKALYEEKEATNVQIAETRS